MNAIAAWPCADDAVGLFSRALRSFAKAKRALLMLPSGRLAYA